MSEEKRQMYRPIDRAHQSDVWRGVVKALLIPGAFRLARLARAYNAALTEISLPEAGMALRWRVAGFYGKYGRACNHILIRRQPPEVAAAGRNVNPAAPESN